MNVAALYCAEETIYDTLLPPENVWKAARDARRYDGDMPVVAHPPCASYCRLRHFARKDAASRSCARIAVWQVRKHGGALEHPAYSTLWRICGLPAAGGIDRDNHGGWTLSVNQYDFGHIALKPTWIYIVGVPFADVYPLLPPARKGRPVYLWKPPSARKHRGVIKKMPNNAARDKMCLASPPDFAKFLLRIAAMAKGAKK